MVTALLGDRLQGFPDDESDIIGDERQRIHGRHVNPAVPAVAVIHDMSRPVAYLRCRVGHSGRHKSGEIGLDLEVDVIGVGIVEPMARLGRTDSVKNVVTRCLIGMPKHVTRIGEGTGEGIGRSIDPKTLEDLHESQVHVYVVVQPRKLLEPLTDIAFGPRDGRIVLNHRTAEAELGGTAVRTADSLAGPAAADLVEKLRGTERHPVRKRFAGRRRTAGDSAERNDAYERQKGSFHS